jgi:hypothetical protein
MSADAHLTHVWLKALAARKVTPAFLRDLVLRHLFSICPVCAKEYAAWVEAERGPRAYDRAFKPISLPPQVQAKSDAPPPVPEDPKAAERDFNELASLPVEECERRIDRSRTRFRGALLCERLIAESDRYLPGNAREAYRFAELAYSISLRSVASATAGVRAAARMGNAVRAMGKLERADGLLGFARYVAASQGVVDTRASAELDRYEGTLRHDQRRFADADALLSRGAKLYEILGDARALSRMQLKLSTLYYYRGELMRAIQTGDALLESLKRESDPILYICAENNLALYLCDAGEYEHALFILENDPEFCIRHGDRHTNFRRLWVAARSAAGLGDLAGAEEALRAVRDVFINEDVGYDAALVSLDLALVYARSGRIGDLRECAETMLPIFRHYELHQEAAAALRLFLESIREGNASVAFVEEIAAYLRQAKFDPSLAFRRRQDVN